MASILEQVTKINLIAYGLNNFCEIGIRYGDTIRYIYENFNVKNYYAIDPFEAYDEYKIDGFYSVIQNESGDVLYDKILNEFKSFPNINIIRKFSTEGIKLIPDNSLDFAYIDANHTFGYVYQDILSIYPKIKIGGIISGDDYYMRHEYYNQKMVYEAVEQFSKDYNIPYETDVNHGLYDSFWYIIKK